MRKGRLALAVTAATMITWSGASAAPTTYNFSGTLYSTEVFDSSNSLWQFAAGQSFSGQFVYDPDSVTINYTQPFPHDPSYTQIHFSSPVKSFGFQIDTNNGSYYYNVPMDNWWNSGSIIDHTSPSRGSESFDLYFINHPDTVFGGEAVPSVSIPPEAYIGTWYPYSVSFSLSASIDKSIFDVTGLHTDWSAFFNAAQVSSAHNLPFAFAIDFTDPAYPSWSSGTGQHSARIIGSLERLERAQTEVPEPAPLALTAFGIGLAGLGLKRRKR